MRRMKRKNMKKMRRDIGEGGIGEENMDKKGR
jgi:hypothetical protein